jgi:hypothetical protein
MSIFAIFKVSNSPAIEAALQEKLPGKHLKLSDGQYLVSAIGTAKAVSDDLGISEGKVGSAIVFKMENYFGRATSDIWEWVKTQAETSVG